MPGPHIHLTHHRRDIAVLRIDRPPVNALAPAEWQALGGALGEISTDPDIRAVVVSGTPRAFCAGADIRSLIRTGQPEPPEHESTMLETVAAACSAMERIRVPVLAAIDGPAHGGGLELALSCDIRMAGVGATFAASSVNMGLIASVSSLVRTVGHARATRMLVSGQRIAAQTALDWGIVTDLVDGSVDGGDVLEAALELAEHIAGKPPLAVEAIKRALRTATVATPAELDRTVTELFGVLVRTSDHLEALASFLEKRPGRYERR